MAITTPIPATWPTVTISYKISLILDLSLARLETECAHMVLGGGFRVLSMSDSLRVRIDGFAKRRFVCAFLFFYLFLLETVFLLVLFCSFLSLSCLMEAVCVCLNFA